MSSRRKAIFIGLTALLLFAMLASCAKATATPEPTTPPEATKAEPTKAPEPTKPEPTTPPEEIKLEVWFLSQSPEEIQNMEDMTAIFEEQHPGVTVEFSPYSFEDFNKTMKLALDSGTGPDLAYGQAGAFGHLAYAKAGHLVDLTEVTKERGWDTEHSSLAINYWKENPDDPVYGVAFDVTDVGVFYNTEIFDELGLTPPETWEDFENILATVKDAGYVPFSCGALDGWTLDHYFQALVHVTVPIEQIEKVYRVKEGVSYLDDGFVQAATILKDWVDKGYFNEGFLGTGYDDQNNLFITAQTAMNLGGTWNNSTFIIQPDFEVGFFPLPRVNPELEWHGMVTPNNIWMVSTYSEHPDLAIDYIDFMLGEEVALAKWDVGDIPTYKFETIPEPIAKLQEDVYKATQLTGLGYYFTDDPQLMEAEWAAIQALAGGSLTPEGAMAQIDELFQKLVVEKQQ
jgi:raffinose/stachyose/melibiose transport system substrate-binding protein